MSALGDWRLVCVPPVIWLSNTWYALNQNFYPHFRNWIPYSEVESHSESQQYKWKPSEVHTHLVRPELFFIGVQNYFRTTFRFNNNIYKLNFCKKQIMTKCLLKAFSTENYDKISWLYLRTIFSWLVNLESPELHWKQTYFSMDNLVGWRLHNWLVWIVGYR